MQTLRPPGGEASRGVSVSEETRGWCLRSPRASGAPSCLLRVQRRRSGGSGLRPALRGEGPWSEGSGLSRPLWRGLHVFIFLLGVVRRLGLLCPCGVPLLRRKMPAPQVWGSLAPGALALRLTGWCGPHMPNLWAQTCGGEGFAFVRRPALWELPLRVSFQVLLQVKLLTPTTHPYLLSGHAEAGAHGKQVTGHLSLGSCLQGRSASGAPGYIRTHTYGSFLWMSWR